MKNVLMKFCFCFSFCIFINIVLQFINNLLTTGESEAQPCQYIENVYKVPSTVGSKLKAFYLWNLQLVIQNQPNSADFMYAVKHQNTEYACDKNPSVVINFLKQVLYRFYCIVKSKLLLSHCLCV